jgi:leucyl aminopeptidase
MPCKLNISNNLHPDYPRVYLLRLDDKGLIEDFSEYILLKKYIQFIQLRIEKKIWLFRLPEINFDIFIHIINKNHQEPYKNKEEFRQAGSRLSKAICQHKYSGINVLSEIQMDYLISWVEGFILTEYNFHKYKKEREYNSIKEITILNRKEIDDSKIAIELNTIMESVYLARDLVNEPGSILTAKELSSRIEKLGKISGFNTEILTKKQIESLKMGGILGVNRGSKNPPTFSILKWKPKKSHNVNPIVLIGKGVVFDTGGLSLKPTLNSMDEMKCDMAGAAAVISVIHALSALKYPIYIIGLIPATDNRPGEDAYLPGDIINIMDGTSVEVLNCDAEGRLLLADALCYARKFKPELVIDIATLTGSAAMAIGRQGSVMFSKADMEKTEKLNDSGNNTYERLVQFPLWEEYKEHLKSDIADLRNIGGKEAGSITAAKFLEHFADYPWIHLDIAGTAFTGSDNYYISKGGTGTGVRLLFDYLINLNHEQGK